MAQEMDLKALFRDSYVRSRNYDALRITAILALTLVPLFWILDLIVLPDFRYQFLAIRLVIAFWSAGLWFAVTRFAALERHVAWLSQLHAWLIVWSIELMTFYHS